MFRFCLLPQHFHGGGMAHIVKNNSDVIDVINPDLTLTGLRIIYEKNQA